MTHPKIYAAAAAALPLSLAVLFATPTLAQDATGGLPGTPGPWTGFYAGANLGGVWDDSSTDTRVGPGPAAVNLLGPDAAAINANRGRDSGNGGFAGGIEGGYNYQMDNWLFGVETDFGAFDISSRKDHTTAAPSDPNLKFVIEDGVKTDWLWTLRPRVGYVTGPFLFYGTAGMAVSRVNGTAKYTDNRTAPNTTTEISAGETKTGWTAGVGAAYAFMPQWSVKGEWLYVDLGQVDGAAQTPNAFAVISTESKVKANLFRVGVDYKF